MAGYGNYCPVALASEVLADRWTPLIVRELLVGNTRFNHIAEGLPGISRSLLVQRLKHLERNNVVLAIPRPNGHGYEYRLTPAGEALFPVLMAFGSWAVQWQYDAMDPNDVTAVNLMWWMHRRIDPSQLPPQRVVVQFEHTTPKRQYFWLVFEHGTASACLTDPGFPVNGTVTAPTTALARVFGGWITWADALRSGEVKVSGPSSVTRALPRWFVWSPWVDDVRRRTPARRVS